MGAAALAAGCGMAAAEIPAPPAEATAFRPSAGVPEEVRAVENALLATVEEHQKPVKLDLYALPPGTTGEAIARRYDEALTGWTPEAPRRAGTVPLHRWTAGDQLAAVAVVQRPTPAGSPVLLVLRSRR